MMLTESASANAPSSILGTTPPSGVSVRIGGARTHLNCGAVRFSQLTEIE